VEAGSNGSSLSERTLFHHCDSEVFAIRQGALNSYMKASNKLIYYGTFLIPAGAFSVESSKNTDDLANTVKN
jgi:predicted Rossmann fold nucleotide-binding protein DprA/Smf involved in DNA uptake